ncbi:MerC domain-containing protein [Arenicella chitinivorans]|uniref:MerC domain-containing protein n=1 Tax=Arenicella chitinivorans TaxID=1329800 RepID=UPI00167B0F91
MKYFTQQRWINETLPWLDRISIGLSTLCVVHCLATPLLLVLVPALGTTFFAGEELHFYLVVGVVPASCFSLGLGCKRHQRIWVALLGIAGLSMLVFALNLERVDIAPHWESSITLLGSLLISAAHFCNFRLCRWLACTSSHSDYDQTL